MFHKIADQDRKDLLLLPVDLYPQFVGGNKGNLHPGKKGREQDGKKNQGNQ
jgi:hypothetical protein